MIDSTSERARKQGAWFGVVATIAFAAIVFTLTRLGPEYSGVAPPAVSARVVSAKPHAFGKVLTLQIPGEPAPVDIVMDDYTDAYLVGSTIDVVEIDDGSWYSAARWEKEHGRDPEASSGGRHRGLIDLLVAHPWSIALIVFYALVQIGWITGLIPSPRRR